MSYIVKEGKVRHNGSFFNVGEEVTGIDEEQAKRLLDLGVIESGDGDVVVDEAPENSITFITPENFKKLSADEQKEQLKIIEIEPGGKAEERLAQYTEWYEQAIADVI